ncbi:hypothetical protein [Dietzia psychralcaliphila]|uniref:Uncharacterized protein n=1 Tax=Dietzia psychralcaliphila TaxID=139021 RepID=A0AAD0NPE0_9ACTN|nr:hypothetical protein [Dietzia psychralcaliphila]AWH97001.1 hypothetical protein A6048_17525 [Dietzia psychralcaliphila]PTM89681.1 hypothetical protein C8N39_102525 [Dietzia psychralcaliphila]
MEFHLAGLGVSLAVLAPGLLLWCFPPREPFPTAVAPAPARWAERAGQALCLTLPAVTASGAFTWSWSVPMAGGLLLYYALWVRYLKTGRRVAALYWWRGIPVPMAILPVVVFLSAAGWLGSPWIAVAALVLAAGHIPVSWVIARTMRESA